LNRGRIRKKNNLGKVIVDGLKLIEFDLFSVATGVFNTKLVKQIIDKAGWKNQLHEAGLLTPISKKLNLKKYILEHGIQHYKHVGAEKGYRKGAWKNE